MRSAYPAIAVAVLLILSGCIQPAPPEPGELNETAVPAPGCGNLTVHIINVSQADAILIVTPANRTILIDSGSRMKSNSSSNLVSFLERKGVTKIDYLIATHYHEDHIGGMEKAFTNFDIGTVYDNGNCANSTTATSNKFVAYRQLKNSVIVKNDIDLPSDGCLSEAKLIVAYDRLEGCWSDLNENSIYLRLVYGNTSFLFTGDGEDESEGVLIAQGTELKADFLKVGHHGSATSSSDAFLDAVGAEYYAISADRERSATDGYYHPRLVTLEKLYARAPSGVFRTDTHGDITAVSNGSAVFVSADADPGECTTFMGYENASYSAYSVIPALTGTCP